MDINSLKNSEWSKEYEELRHNRMVMGAFRYGEVATQDMIAYDYVRELKRRLKLYEESFNLEHLIDVGNMAMLEFMKGKKTGLPLIPIDDGVHNKKIE